MALEVHDRPATEHLDAIERHPDPRERVEERSRLGLVSTQHRQDRLETGSDSGDLHSHEAIVAAHGNRLRLRGAHRQGQPLVEKEVGGGHRDGTRTGGGLSATEPRGQAEGAASEEEDEAEEGELPEHRERNCSTENASKESKESYQELIALSASWMSLVSLVYPQSLHYHAVMKVLLFGRGYLAGKFHTIFPSAETADADIADPVAVGATLGRVRPDMVINCAGKTGRPNIDWCEDHKPETLRSNVTGPLVLLEECRRRSLYWVHLSSGCIYEGDKGGRGFTEDDPPNFTGSFYARTKSWADQILREFPVGPDQCGGVLQLRLRMPFTNEHHDHNLITKLLRYPRVLDVQNSLTYLPDFLKVAAKLIKRRRIGTYNVVNPGTISPYRIMQLYRELVDPTHTFERLTIQDLPTAVKAGRSNCVLSTEKLENEGIRLRPVEETIRAALETYRRAALPRYIDKQSRKDSHHRAPSGIC